MLPVGLLMIEHRLIERMIKVLKTHLKKIRAGRREDPVFIAMVVDFFRTYADRTHHGKEEGILFRDLAKKHLSGGHKKTLDELIAEHVYARQEVTALLDANKKYVKGDKTAVKDINARLEELINFYLGHIEKEDKRFFLPVMAYFDPREKKTMLEKFREFDRKMIHEKYKKAVEVREKAIS